MRTWRWDVVGLTVTVSAVVSNALAAILNIPRIPSGPLFYIPLATLQLVLVVWMWVLARRFYRRLLDQRRAARMNVRIVRDGVEMRARLYHLGERDGLDTWVVLEPDLQPGDGLLVGVLPPRSRIVGGIAGSAGR